MNHWLVSLDSRILGRLCCLLCIQIRRFSRDLNIVGTIIHCSAAGISANYNRPTERRLSDDSTSDDTTCAHDETAWATGLDKARWDSVISSVQRPQFFQDTFRLSTNPDCDYVNCQHQDSCPISTPVRCFLHTAGNFSSPLVQNGHSRFEACLSPPHHTPPSPHFQ